MKTPRSYYQDLYKSLKNPTYAKEYLNAALADDDPRVFLIALGDVAQAHGMSRLAGHTKISREHFYRMLSKCGNPQWDTLRKVLDRIGFRFKLDLKLPRAA